MREKDILDQLLKIIDQIDIDKIGARKKIDEQLERYQSFAQDVLGQKLQKPNQKEISIRNYAKHILMHGKREEKHELLEILKNLIVIKNRAVLIGE